jgi:NAD(P)H-nitrite reductase large subunit
MDTSAQLDIDLRKATMERKKQGGQRCLGKQRDGYYALTVGVPTACFTAQHLHNLADIVEKYARVGHLSTGQSMVLLGIKQQDYYQARQAALDAGLQIRSVGRDVFQVKCCPGADYSPFGLQRTFSLVTLLEETFRGVPTPQKFKIAVSGCSNCCANTRLSDFGVHATVKGWKVYIGGKMGFSPIVAEEIAASVTAEEVVKYLGAVLRSYRELAQPNEKLSLTLKRLGLDEFKAAVEKSLHLPYDDLAALAQQALREMEQALWLGPVDPL